MSEREYCASKARKAAWTLSPKPAMPSSIAGPSKATNVRPRIDSRGRRTAAGLRGCDTQYDSISLIAANVRSAGWYLFKIVVPFLIIILNVHRLGSGCVCLLDKVCAWKRPTTVAIFTVRNNGKKTNPEPTGLEPATSAVTGRRSNQLS